MRIRVPESLKLTVPLILLGFAAILSTVNLLYHVPQAERRAGMTIDANHNELLGHAGILLGSEREELRPSRTGSLFLAYDLQRYKAEARALVIHQSLYWAGWVTALALAMWLVFHFLLTRRTARLVNAAEQLAAGNVAARSGLRGRDE